MMRQDIRNAVLQAIGAASREHPGKSERFITIRYYNDWEMPLKIQKIITAGQRAIPVKFVEFHRDKLTGAYNPFLHLMRNYFNFFSGEELEAVLDACGVYFSHRQMFLSYLTTGFARREEEPILDEIGFEQQRMLEEVGRLVCWYSKKQPFVLVINRFQHTGSSTLALVCWLLDHMEDHDIRLILMLDSLGQSHGPKLERWAEFLAKMEKKGQIMDLSTLPNEGGEKTAPAVFWHELHLKEAVRKIHNMIEFLDFSQARHYLEQMMRKVELEGYGLDTDLHFKFGIMLAYTYIFLGNSSRALVTLEKIRGIKGSIDPDMVEYYFNYYAALANIYGGQAGQARRYAKQALYRAARLGDEKKLFMCRIFLEMLEIPGWHNPYSKPEDMEVSGILLDQARKYGYWNHIAYIQVYAFDNDPRLVRKSVEEPGCLAHFNRGAAWAEKVENTVLLRKAYSKNIQIATGAGMYQVSDYYYLKISETLASREDPTLCQILNGMAYNSCAMGKVERAHGLLHRALCLEQEFSHMGELAAETIYIMAVNGFRAERYEWAFQCLYRCLEIINTLRLNCLKFCDISRIYLMAALCQLFLGNTFSAQRYLIKSESFLRHVLERVRGIEGGRDKDHTICEDLFLLFFAKGVFALNEGHPEEAAGYLDDAQTWLERRENSQFYCYKVFRTVRIRVFSELDEYEKQMCERDKLKEFGQRSVKMNINVPRRLYSVLEPDWPGEPFTLDQATKRNLDSCIRTEGIERQIQRKEGQMAFLSNDLRTFHGEDGLSGKEFVRRPIQLFQNHYNVEGVLIVRFFADDYEIFYNSTRTEPEPDQVEVMKTHFMRSMQGFAVSKLSDEFYHYSDILEVFGPEQVCSVVGIPFFDGERLESVVLSLIYMQDNWHSPGNYYFLDEDDLENFELIFRQIKYMTNNLEKERELQEMSRALRKSAVTDYLTGLYNRDGFYSYIRSLLERGEEADLAILFIDVDNFKPCNDRFGHEAGDLILRRLAQIFLSVSGKDDFVGRYGGDEFLICVPGADKERLAGIAGRIYEELERAEYLVPQLRKFDSGQVWSMEEERVSCSIGIAAMKVSNLRQVQQLLRHADDMMYRAKRRRKGCCVILDESELQKHD